MCGAERDVWSGGNRNGALHLGDLFWMSDGATTVESSVILHLHWNSVVVILGDQATNIDRRN